MATLLIQPPLGGIQKNTGFQNRAPYTAYDLLNVWPIDPFTGRAIIASRAPLNQLVTTPTGVVTLLQGVNGVVAAKPTQSFLAAFGGSLYWWNGTGFTAAGGGIAVPTDRPTFCGTLFGEVYIPKTASKPIVFNYTTGSAAVIVESAGIAPDNTFIITEAMGAIWAVDNDEPHILLASRVGNGKDWNTAAPADDAYGAFSTTVNTPGALGAPINAVIPQTSDAVLISTLRGIFALRGHPRQGGVFDAVSSTYVLGQGAWCKGPDDTVYFLTPKGMMVMTPGYNSVPTLVSAGKIPEEIIGLDYAYDNPVVSMSYCSRWGMVHICVRGPQEQSWMYHVATGGFFRQELDGYPFAMMEHEPFITEQSSGTLLGGTKLRYFDKFGKEVFETAGVIGPIALTGSSLTNSIIKKMKVIFGGDTPTGNGTIAVTTGTDGQDAINRVLLGTSQYTADLAKLAANDGVGFPQAGGQAGVVSFSTDRGRIAIEQIEIAVEPLGINRMPRSAQMPVDGSALDFTAVSNDFDSTNWVGYSQGTPAVPTCSLADHTLLVDLARLPQAWWDQVSATGGDIRVTDNNNVEVPRDVVEFSRGARTGLLTLKMPQQDPPTPVRVWCGNPYAGDYDATAAKGQHNAYDSNWKAFWPRGRGTDRTVNVNHLTMNGLLADPNVAGPIGNLATDFVNGADTTDNFGSTTVLVPAFSPLTLVSAIFNNAATDISRDAMAVNGPTVTNHSILAAERLAGPAARARAISNDGTVSNTASSGSVGTPAAWRHYAAIFASATSRSAFIDGGNKVTATVSVTPATPTSITVGKGAPPGLSQASLQGYMSLTSVHNTARSDCWVDYQARMLNQSTFWGAWGGFQEINDPDAISPPDPAPADVTSCPLGFVTPVEAGTWSGYAQATPDAPAANLADWVHWIDLSIMPAAWWAAVSATGADIRATDQANKFLPLDLIYFNKVANTGFAAVRMSQTTTPVPVRLWVGNGSASALSVCATYGRYRVYDRYWIGFWPDGAGEDRTGNRNDLTAAGSLSVGGVAGTIGNKATNYNGTTQYASRTLTSRSADALLFAAVARFSSVDTTAAILSASRVSFTGHATLANAPYSTPTRLKARSATGDLVDASSTVVESLNAWVHKVGLTAGNIYRGVFVNGAGNNITTDTTLSRKNIGKHLYDRLTIGARLSGSSTIHWPWTGDLTLVSLHSNERALDSKWSSYQNAMLNQAAFWNTWSWTAQSSSLPQ